MNEHLEPSNFWAGYADGWHECARGLKKRTPQGSEFEELKYESASEYWTGYMDGYTECDTGRENRLVSSGYADMYPIQETRDDDGGQSGS